MADQILSQDDIDALLSSIQEGDVDLEKDSEKEIMEKVGKQKEKSDSG